MPESVTTPLTVATLISMPGTFCVVSKSALTLVVIQASLPGWTDSPRASSCSTGGLAAPAVEIAAPNGSSASRAQRLRDAFFMEVSLGEFGEAFMLRVQHVRTPVKRVILKPDKPSSDQDNDVHRIHHGAMLIRTTNTSTATPMMRMFLRERMR